MTNATPGTDLRDGFVAALRQAAVKGKLPSTPEPLPLMSIADAVLAVRDEELEQLRYERRLLGAARMILDLVAAGQPELQEQARREAGDVAQRIVDEIGHPVTDEPALGPDFRVEIKRLRDTIDDAQTRVRLHLSAVEGRERAGGDPGLVRASDLRKILATLAAAGS